MQSTSSDSFGTRVVPQPLRPKFADSVVASAFGSVLQLVVIGFAVVVVVGTVLVTVVGLMILAMVVIAAFVPFSRLRMSRLRTLTTGAPTEPTAPPPFK